MLVQQKLPKILIVEPDVPVREVFSMFVEDIFGAQPLTCASRNQAIDILDAHPDVDLAVMDVSVRPLVPSCDIGRVLFSPALREVLRGIIENPSRKIILEGMSLVETVNIRNKPIVVTTADPVASEIFDIIGLRHFSKPSHINQELPPKIAHALEEPQINIALTQRALSRYRQKFGDPITEIVEDVAFSMRGAEIETVRAQPVLPTSRGRAGAGNIVNIKEITPQSSRPRL